VANEAATTEVDEFNGRVRQILSVTLKDQDLQKVLPHVVVEEGSLESGFMLILCGATTAMAAEKTKTNKRQLAWLASTRIGRRTGKTTWGELQTLQDHWRLEFILRCLMPHALGERLPDKTTIDMILGFIAAKSRLREMMMPGAVKAPVSDEEKDRLARAKDLKKHGKERNAKQVSRKKGSGGTDEPVESGTIDARVSSGALFSDDPDPSRIPS